MCVYQTVSSWIHTRADYLLPKLQTLISLNFPISLSSPPAIRQGHGVYPSEDPFGRPFSSSYQPDRCPGPLGLIRVYKMWVLGNWGFQLLFAEFGICQPIRWCVAGQQLAAGFRAALDGVQADQDFLRVIFTLNSPMCARSPTPFCVCVRVRACVRVCASLSGLGFFFQAVMHAKTTLRSACAATSAAARSGSRRPFRTRNTCIPVLGEMRSTEKRCLAP